MQYNYCVSQVEGEVLNIFLLFVIKKCFITEKWKNEQNICDLLTSPLHLNHQNLQKINRFITIIILKKFFKFLIYL